MKTFTQELEESCRKILGYIGKEGNAKEGTLMDICNTLAYIGNPPKRVLCNVEEPARVTNIRTDARVTAAELKVQLKSLENIFNELMEAIYRQLKINHEVGLSKDLIHPVGLNTSGNKQQIVGDYVKELRREAERLSIQMENAHVCIDGINLLITSMKTINNKAEYDYMGIINKANNIINELNKFKERTAGKGSHYGQTVDFLLEWSSQTEANKA